MWNGTVCLQPDIRPETTNQSVIEAIWSEFSPYSIEAMNASCAGVFDFIEQHCMYFAAIQLLTADDLDDTKNEQEYRRFTIGESSYGPTPAISSDKTHRSRGPHTIGIIYLVSSHFSGTVNLGFSIAHSSQKKGYATQAVRMLITWAFDELKCHRIQVNVAGGDPGRRNAAFSFLNTNGFVQEGVNRRAIFCAAQSEEERAVGIGGQWQDVHTFAILDTEWAIRRDWKSLPSNFIKMRWDEMFERHEKERRLMIALEETAEKYRKTGRKMSTDFVIPIPPLPASVTLIENWECSSPRIIQDDSRIDWDSAFDEVDEPQEDFHNSSPHRSISPSGSMYRSHPFGSSSLQASRSTRCRSRDPFSDDEEGSQGFVSMQASPHLAPSIASSAPSPAPDSDFSDSEAELIPRSQSVASSTNSWDMWETYSESSFAQNMSGSDSDDF